jgi:uncharacterized protein YyaL (SSP411 family)
MKSLRKLVVLFWILAGLAIGAQMPTENHLSAQHSKYLKRASTQPVQWWPLGPEALQLAKDKDLPLLIDVGAVWCSWCTAMDRDSYTQNDIAEFINKYFVAVKIDYDEDPELDAALERAAALANQPAGLPLTLFVTPSQILYFGGTYFPAKATPEKMSFQQALETGARLYRERGDALAKDGIQIHLKYKTKVKP